MKTTSYRRTASAGHRHLVALVVIVAVTAAACGADDTTETVGEADSSADTSAPSDGQTANSQAGDEPTPVVDDDEGYEPTLAMPNITDPRPHPIDDVVVSEDGTTVGVRYEAASEPCSGAVAEVAETADTIEVTLETGLNPDAASMSCIAQIIRYELAVPLDEPLGDRTIVFERDPDAAGDDGSSDESGQGPTSTARRSTQTSRPPETSEHPPDPTTTTAVGSTTDGGTDGLSPPGTFVGLPLDAAGRKATQEGRAYRVGRNDDEIFALTADYDPERLTFEVDGGIVTKAVTG